MGAGRAGAARETWHHAGFFLVSLGRPQDAERVFEFGVGFFFFFSLPSLQSWNVLLASSPGSISPALASPAAAGNTGSPGLGTGSLWLPQA